MVTINGFIQHRSAGWTGIVFTGMDKKQYVVNPSGNIWTYTESRQEKTRAVPESNETILSVLKALELRNGVISMSWSSAELMDALRTMLGEEEGHHASVAASC